MKKILVILIIAMLWLNFTKTKLYEKMVNSINNFYSEASDDLKHVSDLRSSALKQHKETY